MPLTSVEVGVIIMVHRHSLQTRGRPVLAPQRRALILERLRAQGAVRVADLMQELRVSDMTVRRDLEVLEGQGHLVKVHGGATLLRDSAVHEPGFAAKRTLEHEAKVAIAVAAAQLVEPGMAVARLLGI